MMTNHVLARHSKWRDALVLHLRMADVPGDRIGEILLEVESHVAETGETPQQAFGDAKSYATARAEPHHDDLPERGIDIVRQVLLPGLGGFLLAMGSLRLGSGELLSGAIMGIIGVALLVFTFATIAEDPVRHPQSGQPLMPWQTPRGLWTFMAGFWVIAAVVNFFLGRMWG
jgi:hypothetical protein